LRRIEKTLHNIDKDGGLDQHRDHSIQIMRRSCPSCQTLSDRNKLIQCVEKCARQIPLMEDGIKEKYRGDVSVMNAYPEVHALFEKLRINPEWVDHTPINKLLVIMSMPISIVYQPRETWAYFFKRLEKEPQLLDEWLHRMRNRRADIPVDDKLQLRMLIHHHVKGYQKDELEDFFI